MQPIFGERAGDSPFQAADHASQIIVKTAFHREVKIVRDPGKTVLPLNADFLELSKRVIKNEGADPAIGYVAEEDKAKSPYVLFNKINLNEAFLSYIWCNCYSLLVLYREVVVKNSYNEFYGVAEKVAEKIFRKRNFNSTARLAKP
jgi:hypothetical protein